MPHIREAKPTWDAVPAAVKERTETMLGAHVTHARRAFGGYGPSATFVLALDDSRRAFFKGVYPLREGSGVKWAHDEEERVYLELADLISPWAPSYFGSLRVDGWNVMLIEAVSGARMPPWTPSRAERAAHSYAEFHAGTVGTQLPEWLSRTDHLDFAGLWKAMTDDPDALARLAAMCQTPSAVDQATDWIRSNAGLLAASEVALTSATRFALLHFDTRSDNIRLDGDLLRIFDWPWACVGPAEFDLAAFAQSIVGEGGPDAEQIAKWYSEVLPLEQDVLTGSVAGLAGYFGDRGARPDVPDLPRLRAFQRRQFKSTLGWAVRRLGLPDPAWLEGVTD